MTQQHIDTQHNAGELHRQIAAAFPDHRLEAIAALAGDGATVDIVVDWLFDEWDNQAEHDQWLATASNEEIAEWIAAGRR